MRAAVGAVHAAIDPAAAMGDVRRLAELDRHQSSAGIAVAAGYVAERAERAGLADVRVLRFPADGRTSWWTWRSPPAWTPVRSTLAIAGLDGRPLRTVVSTPDQPYALAAYSAATPPGGLTAPLRLWSDGGDRRGTVLLLDDGSPVGPALAAGAVAVVADVLPGRVEPGQVGRLELPPGSPVPAFSVTAAQLHGLVNWARTGGHAHVEVVAATGAGELPVVTGVLPGTGPEELLLTAHLCHPRPSANDNASGVAALLALVPVLDRPSRVGVRFVWGPEFLGLAAYLHSGHGPAPLAAVNVDMAGEDQGRCGGPLIVERSPDDLPSYLNGAVEGAAAALPAAAVSYSGAVGCDTRAWRATPFVGASDHLLVVEPPTGRPAVSLGHWPDRFNHSSLDTVDKVDPAELRRTATVAGAAVATIRAAADGEPADLLDAVVRWSADRVLAAPDAAALAHRAAVGAASIRAVGELAPGTAEDSARWLTDLAATAAHRPGLRPASAAPPDGPAYARGWEGPVNLRALGGPIDLGGTRGGDYARVVAVARALDGRRSRAEILQWAQRTSELPIDADTADTVLGVMTRAGWAVPVDRGAG